MIHNKERDNNHGAADGGDGAVTSPSKETSTTTTSTTTRPIQENGMPPLNGLSNNDEASSTTTSQPSVLSEDTVYEYYKNNLYPALVSSIPILCKRIAVDTKTMAGRVMYKIVQFIMPKWNTYPTSYHPELPSYMVEFWKNYNNDNRRNPLSVADFMLRNFDTNQDGHISTTELAELMKHFWPVLHHTSSNANDNNNDNADSSSNDHHDHTMNLFNRMIMLANQNKETWSTWFTREWPLMDWKIGVFLWRSFGGILFLIAILSIIPGRTHGISAKILRWPILALTYFLVGVELMVYVVIRAFIRIAEDLIARPKHRKMRRNMASAKSYHEWHTFASELDKSQKRDKWLCQVDDHTSHRYNWGFIRELMKDMRKARSKKDSLLALAVIQQCTRKNVGGVMSEDLFSYSNTGEPKSIVNDFIHELCLTLRWITDEASHLPVEDDMTTMTRQESVMYKEKQEKCTNEFQEQVSQENNRLLQSLIHSTLGLFMDNNKSSDKKKTDKNSINEKNRLAKKRERVDVCGNKLSIQSDSSDSLSGGNNIGSPHFSSSSEVLRSLKQQSASHEMLSAVHRREVLAFLKRARQAYGRTALCLSGGAMMGLYHFGHVLGLLESGALPDIISGTSGGSVVGAIICTRTDDELEHDLNPEVLIKHLKCFSRPWGERLKSVWENGNLFSFDEWMELIQWFTCGQMTFEEAFKKTGRIFCVTLSSTTKKAPPILVNYLTAPNVTIASAVIASAAVPGFVPPVRLQYKDKHGVVRSQEGETFFDGSIEQDIPVNGLAEMLNCQFFIACQCNPHIVPFFYNSKGGVGRPSRWSSGTQEDSWRGGFLLAALEMYLKCDMKAKMRFLHDLEAAVGFTSTMMTQDFVGSTTIVPQVSFWDYFRLFADPSLDELYRYFQSGSVAAYEHTAMIKLHYNVADALDECIHKLDVESRREVVFRQRHPRSILFVQEGKKPPQQALTFSPMRRNHSTPESSKESKLKGADSTSSSHTESDDEDEFEREWVTKGAFRK